MTNLQQPWEAVFDRINVCCGPDSVQIPRPTDAELDRVEDQLGSALPLSYRAFLKRFGPGELECTLRLTPVAVSTRAHFTLVEETVEQRAFFSKHKQRNADWLGRVVYFACNAGGDWYVWDPKELATGNGECPVYWLPRHDEDDPQQQADSFFGFVGTVLERVREWRLEEPPEDGMPENAYVPY